MWRYLSLPLALALVGWGVGCANLRPSEPGGCGPCDATGGADDKKCHYDCKAKTLFNWAVCKEDEKDEGDEAGDEGDKKDDKKDDDKKPDDKAEGSGKVNGFRPHAPGGLTPVQFASPAPDAAQGFARVSPAQATTAVPPPALNGIVFPDGSLPRATPQPEEEDSIVTDRPDFTEASSTVGRGRIQLESGYTYFRDRADGATTHTHSYPELLLRVGMFADWFELRVGQNFTTDRTAGGGGATQTLTGAQDLYLGTKLGLAEQKGIFPELALILQTTVPSGNRAVTGNGNRVLPGVSLLYSWDLNDKWALAGSVLGNKAVDDGGFGYTLFASSLSLGHSFTDKVGGYFEYFGFYPHGATVDAKPEYYLNGGLTYLVNNNLQLDVRAGFGLNRASADFFAGSGFAVRY